MNIDIPDYLSDDQKEGLLKVLEAVETQRESVFVGPAGSGKSTLTQEIIRLCERVTVQAAPTGRAAVILREKSGGLASTIHRLLYGGADYDPQTRKLIFRRPSAPCGNHDLLIIDESSMVGKKLYTDLMNHVPPKARVLFIGDKEQLPPVNESWGPDLDHPDAQLVKVHRQAEKSQIIRYATAIRQGRADDWEELEYDASDLDLQVYEGLESAIEWLVDAREKNEDATLLTYTHSIRRRVNEEVRQRLGLFDPREPFKLGDKLVVRSNNHSIGLMNGEVVTVSDCQEVRTGKQYALEFEELPGVELQVLMSHLEQPAEVFQEWRKGCGLPKEEKDLYLHVHYGQCLTVHSSQGSQWKKVGFIQDYQFRRMSREDPAYARRFKYTAVTRAEESLAVFLD